MKTTSDILRQRRVLLLRVFYFTIPQIAENMGITESRVDQDLRITYKRLGVNCLVMALIMALIKEEISLDDIRCFYYTLTQNT